MRMRDISFLLLGAAVALLLGLAKPEVEAQSKAVSVRQVDSGKIVTTPDGKIISESTSPEVILTGADLGLKVDYSKEGRVVGTLMARVDGRWEPVELSPINALAR